MYDSVLSLLAIIDVGKVSGIDYNYEADDTVIEGIPSDVRTLWRIAQNCSA
jgi:hypothetical protein